MYIRSIDKNENKVEIELQDTDFREQRIDRNHFMEEMMDETVSKEYFFNKYKNFIDIMIERSFAAIFGNDSIYTAFFGVGEYQNKVIIEIYYTEGIDEELLEKLDESQLEDYITRNKNIYIINVHRLGNIEPIVDLVNNLEITSSSLKKDGNTYYLTIKTPKRINLDYIMLGAKIREFAELVDKNKGLPLIRQNAVDNLKIIFQKE